jgi:hypothetical protein
MYSQSPNTWYTCTEDDLSDDSLNGSPNMTMRSRTRMVTFRLTEDEYERFRELCFTSGISSVSEMARSAINLFLKRPDSAPQQGLEMRIAELEGRIHALAMEMRQMNGASSPS